MTLIWAALFSPRGFVGDYEVITNMASSPVNPSSPTGTLKRDASKKDSGKLGWVGTLTRRKKGQEGRLCDQEFSLELFKPLRATDLDSSNQMWSALFIFNLVLCYASVNRLVSLEKLNEESPAIFAGILPLKFNFHFRNTLAVCEENIRSIFVNSIVNSSILTHPFLFPRKVSIVYFFDILR